MRHWLWLWRVVMVIILALAGWWFGTPYISVLPSVYCHSDGHCDPPISCDYIGLQGRYDTRRENGCPFVKLLKWDPSRRLFNMPTPEPPRSSTLPPLPPGRVYCSGPAGPVNPTDKPDPPDCVDGPL